MRTRRNEPPDPYAGRYLIDWAYSHGRLDALGDDRAKKSLEAVVLDRRVCKTDAAKRALVSQFRRGQQDERALGQPEVLAELTV